EDESFSLVNKGLSISDPDASSGVVTVTLSVGEGKLTIDTGNSGADLGSGNGTGSVTITGTMAEINSLLAGSSTGTIAYLNKNNTPSSQTTLTLTVNDEGNTGGGDIIRNDTATIFIQNMPEPPVAVDDTVYTNAGNNLIKIPEWALLYNDTDVDSS